MGAVQVSVHDPICFGNRPNSMVGGTANGANHNGMVAAASTTAPSAYSRAGRTRDAAGDGVSVADETGDEPLEKKINVNAMTANPTQDTASPWRIWNGP